jgi:hypothetical protein
VAGLLAFSCRISTAFGTRRKALKAIKALKALRFLRDRLSRERLARG